MPEESVSKCRFAREIDRANYERPKIMVPSNDAMARGTFATPTSWAGDEGQYRAITLNDEYNPRRCTKELVGA